MNTSRSFAWVKVARARNPPSTSRADVKRVWINIFSPLYFIACGLIKHRDKFTLTHFVLVSRLRALWQSLI
jgi:hypothetical protein